MLLTIAKRDNSLLDKGKAITELDILKSLFNIAILDFLDYKTDKFDAHKYKTCELKKVRNF